MFREYESTVDAEGHIEIPREARERHGLHQGARVKIEERDNEFVISPVELDDISDLAGWMSPSNAVEELLRERLLDNIRENDKFHLG